MRNNNKRRRNGGISADVKYKRQLLYDKFGGICQICGIQTDWNDKRIIGYGLAGEKQYSYGTTYPTIEHIVPYFIVKSNDLQYLTLSCVRCNRETGIKYSCKKGCMECVQGLSHPHARQRRIIEEYYAKKLHVL